MNLSETGRLLALAQAYDRRTVGEFDIASWHDALDDIPFDPAETVVRAHYRTSSDWLMPVHVRRGVTAGRGDRVARAELQPPPDIDGDPVRYLEWLRSETRRVADGPSRSRRLALGGVFRRVDE